MNVPGGGGTRKNVFVALPPGAHVYTPRVSTRTNSTSHQSSGVEVSGNIMPPYNVERETHQDAEALLLIYHLLILFTKKKTRKTHPKTILQVDI